jgi:hypothetical protein
VARSFSTPDPAPEAAPDVFMGFGFPASEGWQPTTFRNRHGDVAEARTCELPDGFTARLRHDLDGLRAEAALDAVRRGGGLIEADPALVNGAPAFQQVLKLAREHGLVYVASLTVPVKGSGVEVTVTCEDAGVPWLRESVVIARYERATSPFLVEQWAGHPYVEGLTGGLPRTRADDVRYDQQLPDHALSRARRAIAELASIVKIV